MFSATDDPLICHDHMDLDIMGSCRKGIQKLFLIREGDQWDFSSQPGEEPVVIPPAIPEPVTFGIKGSAGHDYEGYIVDVPLSVFSDRRLRDTHITGGEFREPFDFVKPQLLVHGINRRENYPLSEGKGFRDLCEGRNF